MNRLVETRLWNLAAPIVALLASTTAASCGKPVAAEQDGPCQSDDDCPWNEVDAYVCIDGVCDVYHYVPHGQECAVDADCDDDYACANGFCLQIPPLVCADRVQQGTHGELLHYAGDFGGLAFMDAGDSAGAELLISSSAGLVLVDTEQQVRELLSEPLQAVAAGDIDGDGHDDIVVVESSGVRLRVLLSDGEGAFTEAAGLEGGGWPPALGDLTGDGHVDIVARGSLGYLLVYPGHGDGGFGEPVAVGGMNAFASDEFVVLPPSDGVYADLLYSAETQMFLARGSTGLVPEALVAMPESSQLYSGIAVGDHDGDGRPDASSNLGGGLLTWRDVTARDEPSVWIRNQGGRIATGDLDGDGLDELVVADGSGQITVRFGQPAAIDGGALGCTATVMLPNFATYLVGVGDVDGDGRADVISAESDRVWWTRSQ